MSLLKHVKAIVFQLFWVFKTLKSCRGCSCRILRIGYNHNGCLQLPHLVSRVLSLCSSVGWHELKKKLSYLLYIQFCTKWNSCLVKISDSTVVAMRYSLHFECNNSIQFWSFYSTSSITAVSGGVIFSFSLNVGLHCHSVICNTGNNQGFVCA